MTDLEFVCDLARRAATLALAAAKSLQHEVKEDHSLVTNIDRGLEAMIREELAARFPGDGFYGEESGGEPLASDRLWIVDPIDGTTNMVFGLPVWGVSIGLAVRGEPKLGAFCMPRFDELYWFEAGQGSYCNGERLRALERGPFQPEDPIGIGSEAILRLDMSRFRSRQRNFGSLAAHWCWAGSGALRANVSVHDRLHDLGAAFGVAREAGCAIEYLDGGAVSFSTFLAEPLNRRPLVVGPPETVARLREVIRPHSADVR